MVRVFRELSGGRFHAQLVRKPQRRVDFSNMVRQWRYFSERVNADLPHEGYDVRFDLNQASQLCERAVPDHTQLQVELHVKGRVGRDECVGEAPRPVAATSEHLRPPPPRRCDQLRLHFGPCRV